MRSIHDNRTIEELLDAYRDKCKTRGSEREQGAEDKARQDILDYIEDVKVDLLIESNEVAERE